MSSIDICIIALGILAVIEAFCICVLWDKVNVNEERVKQDNREMYKLYDRNRDLIFEVKDHVMERLDPFLSSPEEEAEFVAALKQLIEDHREENEEVEIVEVEPYLISASDYYFSHGLGQGRYELRYHKPSNEVRYYTSETDYIVVDNVEEAIGVDALRFFGVRSSDPNVVYVRNLNFEADFRIVKEIE